MELSPDQPFTLPEPDVRKIVNLLGGVIAAPGDIHEKRRLLMNGLCVMIDATAWVWAMSEFHPDKPPSSVGLLHGGFDETRFAYYLDAINHPDIQQVIRHSSSEYHRKGTHLTRTRRQMEPDHILEASAAAAYWDKADIGDLMVSTRPMEGGGVSAIGIYRNLGGNPFNERQAKIAHILLSEVPWLHFHSFPDQPSREITKLYPRHRMILNCLCEGWTRQKIADHLGLRVNTVHGYVKVIFKHFRVHSQSQLVARFSKGDDGDQ